MNRFKSKINSDEVYQPVVLITGCNSGIGLALAEKFYHLSNYRVVITARSLDGINVLRSKFFESERFRIRALDVTNDTQRERLIASIYSEWKAIDILINNAGVSYRSVIEHMDEESEMHQLNVNYLGPLALIRSVIPTMREKGFGHIINISSVSGMMAMPTMASYSASKHALEGATEALWYELKPYGISVSLIQPGFIHSNSFEKVKFSRKAQLSKDLNGPYAEYYSNMGPFIKRLMGFSMITPHMIANKIIKTIDKKNPSLWIPVTPDALIFGVLRKFLPKNWFHKFMYYLLPSISNWGFNAKKSKQEYFDFASEYKKHLFN